VFWHLPAVKFRVLDAKFLTEWKHTTYIFIPKDAGVGVCENFIWALTIIPEEMRKSFRTSVDKYKYKTALIISKVRWGDNIKMGFKIGSWDLIGSVDSRCAPVTGSYEHGVKSFSCIKDGAFFDHSWRLQILSEYFESASLHFMVYTIQQVPTYHSVISKLSQINLLLETSLLVYIGAQFLFIRIPVPTKMCRTCFAIE
jgi:hypothetical protein